MDDFVCASRTNRKLDVRGGVKALEQVIGFFQGRACSTRVANTRVIYTPPSIIGTASKKKKTLKKFKNNWLAERLKKAMTAMAAAM